MAFGWLFLSPASADDPITLGGQRIEDLNNKLNNLTDKTKTQELISIAEDKYDTAVEAQNARNASILAYENAVTAEASALSELNNAQDELDIAQSDLNDQQEVVDSALQNKNDARDLLDIANINLQTSQSNMQSAGGSGLHYTVYNLARVWPSVAVPDSVICSGTWNSSSMQLPVCGNRYENIVVKFTGQITVPSHWTSTYFAGYTDDGFKMYVDGQLAISNWVEQGVRWSEYSPVYDVTEDKTFDVEIWWYNGGGPGSYHLGWAIPGGWTGAGCDYTGGWGVGFSCNLNTFSSGSGPTQAQIDAYNNALSEKNLAQNVYNDKLNVYNQEVEVLNDLQDVLDQAQDEKDSAQTAYETAQSTTASALISKDSAVEAYNNSISDMNDAITDAEEQYISQWDFEEKQRVAAAIAVALANMPQPAPSPPAVEPTPPPKPEPKPSDPPAEEPKPEPTPPVANPDPDGAIGNPKPEPKPEPAPEPKPEPKPEPAPEPEPKPEPAPEPPIEPMPEPKPLPRPDFKPAENIDPAIKDEALAALIPQKGTGTSEDLSGVIANLTSKDNKLVKLSPEQTAAVSQTLKALTQEAKQEIAKDLGISSAEVAKVAEIMKADPAVASAFVEFAERAGEAGNTAMPFTLADATTEVQTEEFLEDPLGAVLSVDVTELLSNFSELGMDMTDDQREKAQEVIIPVVIVSQIASTLIGMRR